MEKKSLRRPKHSMTEVVEPKEEEIINKTGKGEYLYHLLVKHATARKCSHGTKIVQPLCVRKSKVTTHIK
jgi:hypothetical protein